MRITFTFPDDIISTVEIAPSTSLSDLKMLASIEGKLKPDTFIMTKDGNILSGKDTTMCSQLKIGDGDLIVVTRNLETPARSISQMRELLDRQNSDGASTSNVPQLDFSSINLPGLSGSQSGSAPRFDEHTENARQMLLKGSPYQLSVLRERNPELANCINDKKKFAEVFRAQRAKAANTESELVKMMSSDQFDPQVQQKIESLIQQRNIDTQMEGALEHYPETFGQVTMLYVACKVQGHSLKAFVDSGAQTTIMSERCAKRCGLERLVDKRWAGKAYGVGTQNIIGRVHNSLVELGGIFIPTSFIVLQDQQLDMLIGLDMLKRHRCTIDLARNVLSFEGKVDVPFLPESELPASAQNTNQSQFETPSGECSDAPSLTSEQKLTDDQEVLVTQLESNGVPRATAIRELQNAGWDLDKAYATYLRNAP